MSSIREQFEEQLDAGALAEPGVRAWCYENREIIAAALKTQEAFDRGESDSDFYCYERDNATETLVPLYTQQSRDYIFRRGFLEGWKAARRFVIQDPE